MRVSWLGGLFICKLIVLKLRFKIKIKVDTAAKEYYNNSWIQK